MDRETAKQEIKDNWFRFYEADRRGKGIICPLCGSGSGKNGTGITENPDKPGYLKCWNGACEFNDGGDIIALKRMETGQGFMEALYSMADELGIVIDDDKGQPIANKTTQATTQTTAENAPKTPENKSGFELFNYTPTAPKTAIQKATETGETDYTEYYAQCRKNLNNEKENSGNSKAISYLKARGISWATASFCHLGYDPKWISPTAIKRMRAEGKPWTPEPTARIIIPVTESHYIARAIDPKIEQYQKMNEGKPGIFNLKALYKKYKVVFVVEGAFDALSILECDHAAIALNSTSNARLLIKTLQDRRTDATLVLCLDNDDSGKKTTEKLKDELLSLNYRFITADINGKYNDPNEHLTGNREEFMEAIKAAEQEAIENPESVQELLVQEKALQEKAPGEAEPKERPEEATPEKVTPEEKKQEAEPLPGILTYNDAVNIFKSADDKIIELKYFPMFGKTAKIKLHDSVVIAADTGAGKSSLAINFLNDLNSDYPCIYLNLEMDIIDVLRRLIAIYSGLELDRIEGYKNDENTAEAVNSSLKAITERKPLQVIQDAYILEDIEAIIEKSTKDRKEPTIVFIDHGLLVDVDKSAGRRYDRFTQVSEELRKMALKYNIILFILLQQSREGKADNNERPKNSSLKESGSWENDATQIVFLWKDPNDNDKKKLLLTKNRHGICGDFALNYYPKTQTYKEEGFTNVAPGDKTPFDDNEQKQKFKGRKR